MMHSQNRFIRLILCSDTRPTRFAVFIGAAAWSIGLLLPGDTMTRPSFAYMGSIAPESAWLALWTLYAIGMFAYTFSRHPLPETLSYMINALGLGLWSVYTLMIIVPLPWPWPAGLGADISMLLASFWLMMRTGSDNLGDRRGG